MQDWASFATGVFIVVAILALFLPRRYLLLLGTAALAGIVACVLVEWLVSPRNAYFNVIAVPALCVVSAILGYVWPRKAWQWGLTPFLAQAIWQVLGPYSKVKWSNLGPIPYVFPFYSAVLLAIPAMIAAEVAAFIARRRQKTPTNMHTRSLSALLCICLLASSAAAQEMSFVRVVHCKNEVGRAELYLPGSVVLGRGPDQVRLGDQTVSGYLAYDFTPVGKNKTLNAADVSMSEKKDSLIVKLLEGGSPAMTIPVRGGTTRFPQRLAEEMTCEPLNAD